MDSTTVCATNDNRCCDGQVVAMAYVPDQGWGDIYDESTALKQGTLFPELNKPFTGRKQVHNG